MLCRIVGCPTLFAATLALTAAGIAALTSAVLV